MLRQMWNEESGAVLSAEIVLIVTILVIGLIVGLKSLRDAVVSELADVAQAVSNLNQTYSFGGVRGHKARTEGSTFTDRTDFCDTSAAAEADPATRSRCVEFAIAATNES